MSISVEGIAIIVVSVSIFGYRPGLGYGHGVVEWVYESSLPCMVGRLMGVLRWWRLTEELARRSSGF